MGAADGVEQGVRQRSSGGREVRAGADDGGLDRAVAFMVGVKLQGVFRTVMTFL